MPDCFCVPDAGARCSSARGAHLLRIVPVCPPGTCCDRGQQYCGARCSGLARRESLRAAGRRYQQSRRGRHCHRCARRDAERQRRYRRRYRAGAAKTRVCTK